MKNNGLRVCQIIFDIFSMLVLIGELLLYLMFDHEQIVITKYFYIGVVVIVSQQISYAIYFIITLNNRNKKTLSRILQVYCFLISFFSLYISFNVVVGVNIFLFFLVPFAEMIFVFFSIMCQEQYEQNIKTAEENKLIQSTDKGNNEYTNVNGLYPSTDDGNNTNTPESNLNKDEIYTIESEKEIIDKPCDSNNIPPPANQN